MLAWAILYVPSEYRASPFVDRPNEQKKEVVMEWMRGRVTGDSPARSAAKAMNSF